MRNLGHGTDDECRDNMDGKSDQTQAEQAVLTAEHQALTMDRIQLDIIRQELEDARMLLEIRARVRTPHMCV